MESSDKRTVFISYAREDAESSERLYNDLRNASLIPWRDKDVIKPGQNWKMAIRKGIKSSRYFMPLFSSKSVEKIGYVQKEFKYAIDNFDQFPESETYIIPMRLDNCDIPFEKLEDIQYVDLFPDWDKGVKQILESIGIEPEGQVKKGQEEENNLNAFIKGYVTIRHCPLSKEKSYSTLSQTPNQRMANL